MAIKNLAFFVFVGNLRVFSLFTIQIKNTRTVVGGVHIKSLGGRDEDLRSS